MSRFSAVLLFAVIITNGALWTEAAWRTRRNALKSESRRWPKAIVPYEIDNAFSFPDWVAIRRAMKEIQYVSCIKFKKRKDENVYLDVMKGDDCSADVGYTGMRRELILGKGCVTQKIVLHELFHVLGFFHEHSRPDRDDFINILLENVKPGKSHNFRKKSENDVTSFGLPYDFRSIMHYRDSEFSVHHSKKTIVPRKGKAIVGEAEGLSHTDIRKLNKLYKCKQR